MIVYVCVCVCFLVGVCNRALALCSKTCWSCIASSYTSRCMPSCRKPNTQTDFPRLPAGHTCAESTCRELVLQK